MTETFLIKGGIYALANVNNYIFAFYFQANRKAFSKNKKGKKRNEGYLQ